MNIRVSILSFITSAALFSLNTKIMWGQTKKKEYVSACSHDYKYSVKQRPNKKEEKYATTFTHLNIPISFSSCRWRQIVIVCHSYSFSTSNRDIHINILCGKKKKLIAYNWLLRKKESDKKKKYCDNTGILYWRGINKVFNWQHDKDE